jgi:hypothetical protein
MNDCNSAQLKIKSTTLATTVYLSFPELYHPRVLFRAASGPMRHRLSVDDFGIGIEFD